MEWEDIPSISWSMIWKMEESRSRAMRLKRAADQKRVLLKELKIKKERQWSCT